MRIAQVAPLFESVPPLTYGGTERVVSYLTEELVRRGHEVTLFASGDSETRARLVSPCSRALRLDPDCRDPMAAQVLLLEEVWRRAEDFDLIHFHCGCLHFPMARRLRVPHVTTHHGRLDLPEVQQLQRKFRELPLISISDAQRRPMPWANWVATVHHGLPLGLYRPSFTPGRHLLFLGRISPEKRPDRAVEIAERAGMPLVVAAKVDAADRRYFEERIRPLLARPFVEYVGEVGEQKKQELLAGAAALLFPIDWPEPFGMVMIEAMACGTPVIAFPHGSVPEVLEHAVTGFIVPDVSAAVAAVARLGELDRRRIRRRFEERFSVERFASEHERVYERLIGRPAGRRLEEVAA